MSGNSKTTSAKNELSFLENHFDADNVADLEKSLETQMNGGTYDFDNNLALMKVYQTSPKFYTTGRTNLTNVLIKALMSLPGNDFIFLSALIPKKVIDQSKDLKVLMKLNTLLRSADFVEFWATVRKTDADLKISDVKCFEQNLRLYIASMVRCAYRKLEIGQLLSALDLTEASPAFLALVKSQGWTLDRTSATPMVTFPANENNQDREKMSTDDGMKVVFNDRIIETLLS